MALKKPKVNLDLIKYKKCNTPTIVFEKEVKSLQEQYQDHIHIFTDGSKDNMAVGSASHSVIGDRVCGLSIHSSVFTSECIAIQMALKTIESSHQNKFIIFSDSLSALQSISNIAVKNPHIHKIISHLETLYNNGKDIIFCWIPSHTGIKGNEEVDAMAKVGLELNPENNRITASDCKPVINNMIRSRWSNRWQEQTNNKLYQIQNHLGLWPKAFQARRRDETVLSRIRSGHTKLTHSFLLRGEDPPICIPCDCNLTISHILLDCLDFRDIREHFYSCKTMKDLFNIIHHLIFAFLKETGLYEKI